MSSKSDSASLSSGYADFRVSPDSISGFNDLDDFTNNDFISKDFGYDFDTIDTHCSETGDTTSRMMTVKMEEAQKRPHLPAGKAAANRDALRSQADSYFSERPLTLIPCKIEYDQPSLSLSSDYLSSLVDETPTSLRKVKAQGFGRDEIQKDDDDDDDDNDESIETIMARRLFRDEDGDDNGEDDDEEEDDSTHVYRPSRKSTTMMTTTMTTTTPTAAADGQQGNAIFENIEQGSALRLQLDVDEILVAFKAGDWSSVRVAPEDVRARRRHRLMRYKEKRQKRSYQARVRYEVRKRNAEMRPRLKGRFVKLAADDTAMAVAPAGDKDVVSYMPTIAV